jgi:hypothetical protein
MVSFASELGTEFKVQLEADHVIDAAQTWVGAVPCTTTIDGVVEFRGTFKDSESYQYQDVVGTAICEIAKRVPNGFLVFVPSYAFLDKLMQRWRSTKLLDELEAIKRVLLEPRVVGAGGLDEILSTFYGEVDPSKHENVANSGSLNKSGYVANSAH